MMAAFKILLNLVVATLPSLASLHSKHPFSDVRFVRNRELRGDSFTAIAVSDERPGDL